MSDDIVIKYSSGASDEGVLRLICAGCKRRTKHSIRHSFHQSWSSHNLGMAGYNDYLIAQCDGCEGIQFCKRSSDSETFEVEEDEKGNNKVVYPDTIEQYPPVNDVYEEPLNFFSTPPEIKESYTETYNALANNLLKLSAIGVRMTLELICLDHQIRSGTLESKIEKLWEKHLISGEMKNLLQKVRIFGNNNAHTKNLPSVEDLKNAWVALNTVIRYIYGTRDTKSYFHSKRKHSQSS